jgi:hypothetical protein
VEVFTGEKSRSAREDVRRRDIGVGGIGTERGCCLRDGKEGDRALDWLAEVWQSGRRRRQCWSAPSAGAAAIERSGRWMTHCVCRAPPTARNVRGGPFQFHLYSR